MRFLLAAYGFTRSVQLLVRKRGIHIVILVAILVFVSLAIYIGFFHYDDTSPRIQHFQFSRWKDCISSGAVIVNSSLHDPRWQRVVDGVYVFSAFVTHKHPPQRAVEIMAVMEIAGNKFLEDVECGCVFSDGKGGDGVKSEIRVANERYRDRHEEAKYGDVRFICDIPFSLLPTSVGIQCHSRSSCGLLPLPLHQLPDQSPRKLSFALCGPVLYGDIRVDRLVEFIEYYQLIGVEKFIFYVYEITADVQRVLAHYREKGTVDLIVWRIPGLNIAQYPPDVWYYAQMSAANDCLERTGYLWDYSIEVDLDEFIAVTNRGNLSAVMRHGQDDCVILRSTNMQLPPARSLLLHSASRQSYIYPASYRTKYICRGRQVLAAGIHYPHFLRPGARRRYADPDAEAVVLHMREKLLFDGWWPWEWRWVEEQRGAVYADQVGRKVERVLQLVHVV